MSSFAVPLPPMMLEGDEGPRDTLDNRFEKNERRFEIMWVTPATLDSAYHRHYPHLGRADSEIGAFGFPLSLSPKTSSVLTSDTVQ